ncbi:MAG: hypothetical protein NTV16_01200 [Actinobacteria bacterium]|nr:hypothetical protein [Actinomycetota bacterium]
MREGNELFIGLYEIYHSLYSNLKGSFLKIDKFIDTHHFNNFGNEDYENKNN